MGSQIDLFAIIIADIMGLTILFTVSISSLWTTKMSPVDNRILRVMFISSAVSCIADSVSSIVDGKPGLLNCIFVFAGNTWLYIGNIIIAIAWVFLVATHLNRKISKGHKMVLAILGGTEVLLLFVNIFTPIVFSVSEDNVYSRTGIYQLYYILPFLLIADGLFVYFYVRQKSGKIKFFPAWAFIVPVAIGTVIQGHFYGVSTITPFITVSIGCVTACLQNEFLFRDKLTGLYNQFYMDMLEKKISKNDSNQYSIIMLDINGFKKINDTYGHRVGNKALIELSRVLRDVIKENGEVIRYAGDEFIIILNTQDDLKSQDTMSCIHEALDCFNKMSGNPYELSLAMGYCKLDMAEGTMDALFDKVDKLMYENKRAYYEK